MDRSSRPSHFPQKTRGKEGKNSETLQTVFFLFSLVPAFEMAANRGKLEGFLPSQRLGSSS
jgi:hypothetical protein